MKITAALLLIACLQVSATGKAQTITLSFKNAPLEEVFKEVKKQTGYRFIYTQASLKEAKNITLEISNATIEQVLPLIFKDQPFTYSLEGKIIVLKRSVPISTEEQPALLPPVDIKGKIVNEKGEAVPLATVLIKGTSKQTSSNENGEFLLKGTAINDILVISSIGFETQEIRVKSSSFITVQLRISVKKLDETVVIAYGITSERYNIGSVTKVSSDDIATQPISNPLAALEGRVPGLVVTQTSGVPGASFNIQIRGQNSLNASPNPNGISPLDNPLFIIDGVPFAAQNGNINQFQSLAAPGTNQIYGNPYGGISPLNSLNPSDIESISILRDADATAIYGSRGANGVVLITTKKGKAGKAKFDLTAYTGISKVTRTMPLLNLNDYLSMRHEALNNDGLTPTADASKASYSPDLLIFDTTKYTDWKKFFLGGTSHVTDINGSLSGGSANTQFLIGSSFHRDTYVTPGNFSDNRISFNSNLHHQSSDRCLLVDFSVNYSYDRNNSSGSPSTLTTFTLPPNYPDLLDAAGNLIWNYKGVDLYQNPLGYIKQGYTANTYNLIGHLQLEYQLFQGFTLRSSFGYNAMNMTELSTDPVAAQDPINHPISKANFGTNDLKTWIIEPQTEYKKKISNGELDILAGGTFQQNTKGATQIHASNYSNDALLGSISAAGNTYSTDSYTQYKYAALFGRLNYTLNKRYIVNLTGRRDGSSRFGPGKQYGNFGSVGMGWLFREEPFFKRLTSAISYGKARITYGTTGNDNIGDYQYLSAWAPSSSYYGLSYAGASGFIPQNLYNPSFSWSVNKKLEAGLEIGTLQAASLNRPKQTGVKSFCVC